jgi:hypothetical protein
MLEWWLYTCGTIVCLAAIVGGTVLPDYGFPKEMEQQRQ